MAIQKWIQEQAIRGNTTFSIEDVRATGLCSSEQILLNELGHLCRQKKIACVYKGFYSIFPTQYILRGTIPPSYYIDQLMHYLGKPYYISLLSAAELHGAAHQRPQHFSVTTTYPRSRATSHKNALTYWTFRPELPQDGLLVRNSETGTIVTSNPLLTATDLVAQQQHVGGLSRVATVLEELAEKIDLANSYDALTGYVQMATWQRLGYLLDTIDAQKPLANELHNRIFERDQRIKYVPLSTTSLQKETQRDRRWKIIVNTTIEPDDL